MGILHWKLGHVLLIWSNTYGDMGQTSNTRHVVLVEEISMASGQRFTWSEVCTEKRLYRKLISKSLHQL